MKADLKAKWVAALRSGRYKQTKGHLSDDLGYCCLGVLCDVVDPHGWADDCIPLNDNHAISHELGDENELSVETLASFGLTKRLADELMERNDGFKVESQDFNQIADFIDANVPVTSV